MGTHPSMSVEDQARTIVENLGGTWRQRGGLCQCPAHADKTPSLSVRVGRSAVLFHCFAGCEQEEVIEAIRHAGALTGPLAKREAVENDQAQYETWLRGKVAELWAEARPITGTIAEAYLVRHRGLAPPFGDMRFHRRTPYGPKPVTVYRPALLVAVRDDAGLVAVQRIFLDPATGAKARMEKPKAMLGVPGSGASRLGFVPTTRLGLAEGVEDAKAAWQMTGTGTWSANGAERLASVAIPARVTHLTIFAQNDAPGQRAAEKASAAHAMSGRTIVVEAPPVGINDWSKLLMASRPPRP